MSSKKRPLVLVTGGTGFLGSALSKSLLEKGFRVRVSTRIQGKLPSCLEGKVDLARGFDLAEETDWNDALVGVDFVVHCAARVHVLKEHSLDPEGDFLRENVTSTLRLASQAADLGISRFVFISSIGVNGGVTFDKPFRHDDAPSPVSPYAHSKYLAEKALRKLSKETGLEVVSIRPPLIYGKDAPGNFSQLTRLIDSKVPLPFGLLNNKRSFVSVENIVDFIGHSLTNDKAAGEVFLISDGKDVSTRQFIKAISHANRQSVVLLPVPLFLLKVLFLVLGKAGVYEKLCGNLQLDIEHTKSTTGWRPVTAGEGSMAKHLLEEC